jgi:hypothetical protein
MWSALNSFSIPFSFFLFISGQFSFGIFYAYVKLKEQEIRNVHWISDVTILGRPELMKENFIPIFDKNSPWRTGALAEAYERTQGSAFNGT